MLFWHKTCEYPTRKTAAPALDFIEALELKIEEARSQDVNEQSNKTKDDIAERNDAQVSDSVERFDVWKVLT